MSEQREKLAEVLADVILAAIEGQPAHMTETGPLVVSGLPRCYASPMADRAAQALLASDVLAQMLAEARAEALREAGVWLAGQRNGATGRRLANAELFGEMLHYRGNEIEYQFEREAKRRAALAAAEPDAGER